MGEHGPCYDADGHVMETLEGLTAYGWEGSSHPTIDNMINRAPRDPSWRSAVNERAFGGAFDVEGRLQDMDAEGIDVSVCFPSALMCVSDADDVARGVAASRVYNDWFAGEYHDPAPDRLVGVAVVSLADIPAAVAEAERAVTQLGAVGVMLPPYAGERHLDDPEVEPLWDKLEELGVPAGIHGGRSINFPHLRPNVQDPRGGSFKSNARFYAMVHPFHQMFAMADLALGGVLHRHPRLKVAFLEAGCGWMPTYIDRLDEAFESFDAETGGDLHIDRKPSEYLLSGNCWFSCEPGEPNLPLMVDALGQRQVVFASDYPHFDASFPESVRKLAKAGLSPSVFAQVTGDNVRALYGL